VRIGDYEIEAELGEGGMAKVYRARHAILETVHALKVLDPEYRANAEARRRFLDEAKIQAKHLVHANIVKVTNIVATADHAALVMELVDGGSLESVLHELKTNPPEITRIMLGVLDAVGHAHASGIIHRDLKPANVLLARESGALVPKVTDFGIAKVTDASGNKAAVKKSTHMASRMGTLAYMSPEQIRRAKDVTARSDIFSLGAMLYELATGELPFPGESEFDVMENIVNGRYTPPRQRYPQIDAVHAQVIEKAMATDPAQRYASCAEMAAALRGAAVVAVTPAPSPPPPPQPQPEPPRPPPPAPLSEAAPARSKVPLVAGLCLVGALGLGGAALYLARRSDSATPAGGSAASSGSAALDSQKVVAALRERAARIDAGDPWAGSGGARWDLARREFPAGFETPPASALSTDSGVRYMPLTTNETSTRRPRRGERVLAHLTLWTTTDHQLLNSTLGKAPPEIDITAATTLGEVLMTMTEHSTVRSWFSAPDTPPVVAEIELVEIKRWLHTDTTFPASAKVPPSNASTVGATRYVLLSDDRTTTRAPRPGDHAKINYKMWRVSDGELADSNVGGPPVDLTIAEGSVGRSEVLQRMTAGDVARLWTVINLVDANGKQQEVSPMMIEMELVSISSTR